MIVTTSILMLPLIVLVWAIDSYLFVLTVRVFLCRRRMQESAIGQPVLRLTEPSIRMLERLLINRLNLHPPRWGAWMTLVGLLLLTRTALVLILV